MAPTANTRAEPYLSATAPAIGTQAPQISIWSATERAKTSRPQPNSVVIGVRNSPEPERTPKAMKLITQPAPMMTAGLRQSGPGVAGAGALTLRPPRGAGPAPREWEGARLR